MDLKDLRKTTELPAVEQEGGMSWTYANDPLGAFSHRRETETNERIQHGNRIRTVHECTGYQE